MNDDVPLTIEAAAAALRSGELTSVELLERCAARADALDRELGTYLARFDDTARHSAAEADAAFARGEDLGPLHGIPLGIKDILATVEGPTTAQSLVLDPTWGAGRDATAVARLRAAGAVITGKTTTMEFAIGFPDTTKPFPLPRNPWDATTWAGGSSSGTATGIATGMFLAGLGTDTGGSIRLPSTFCGVTGLMPTFGRVPRTGVVPLGYSLDHVGPMARSAWDCAALLDVIAGADGTDAACAEGPVPHHLDALADVSLRGMRIGLERVHHTGPADDPAAAGSLDAACAVLTELGATVVEVEIPHYVEGNAATLVTLVAEASAYHQADLRGRWADYFAGSREFLGMGAFVSGADYVQAQRVRRACQRSLAGLFDEVDAILMATSTVPAPTFEWIEEFGVLATAAHAFTTYWDGMGNPVLALPIGPASNGLPLGAQLAGRPYDEGTILRIGHALQQATSWHLQVPPVAVAHG